MRLEFNEAVSRLKSGEVVAIPTETVYGLAACLGDIHAIKKIYSLKSRPEKNPLIIHLHSASMIKDYVAELPLGFNQLAQEFWPGPLTMVIPYISKKIPQIVTAGLPTAAFRVPEHPVALALLEMTGPLVMPSANISGKPSATSADHVEADFGQDFPVLDGGDCIQGLESTILYWNGQVWVVARLGSIAPVEFARVLGYIPEIVVKDKDTAPICPGQIYRHYAPKAHLILTESVPENGPNAVVGFIDRQYPKGKKVYSLGSLTEARGPAQMLYAVLRQLDDDGVERAFVDIDFPAEGLWLTLKERLLKAASA